MASASAAERVSPSERASCWSTAGSTSSWRVVVSASVSVRFSTDALSSPFGSLGTSLPEPLPQPASVRTAPTAMAASSDERRRMGALRLRLEWVRSRYLLPQRLQRCAEPADTPQVRTLALLRRARGLAAIGAAGIALTVMPAAHAESTGEAEAKARAILAQVQQLQQQVRRAEARYDAALAGVASSVSAAIQTDEAREQAAAQTSAAAEQMDDRVRGLYMSGGPLALYASVLGSGDFNDLQARVVMVDSLVDADKEVLRANQAVSTQVAAMARQAQARAHREIATERSVRDVAAHVLALLAQQQKLLDEAQSR